MLFLGDFDDIRSIVKGWGIERNWHGIMHSRKTNREEENKERCEVGWKESIK